jgi:hypothetical protein
MVFHSMPQAKIIQGLLEANNIRCFLSTETAIFGTFFTNDSTIQLYVMEEDYSTAKELLAGLPQDDE